MFYSATTKGFYLPAINGDAIPSDAVEITDEAHTLLIEGQSSGMVISTDANGVPVLIAPEPVPQSVLKQIESMEREQLMPRATREFMLMFMEANAPAEVLAVNPGYQAVKVFDNQIVTLRSQLS